LKNFIAKVILVSTLWPVTYAVCLYPLSFLNGLIWGFTLKVAMNYMVYEHPDSPFQVVMGSMLVLGNMALATFITVRVYRRVWPEVSRRAEQI